MSKVNDVYSSFIFKPFTKLTPIIHASALYVESPPSLAHTLSANVFVVVVSFSVVVVIVSPL